MASSTVGPLVNNACGQCMNKCAVCRMMYANPANIRQMRQRQTKSCRSQSYQSTPSNSQFKGWIKCLMLVGIHWTGTLDILKLLLEF